MQKLHILVIFSLILSPSLIGQDAAIFDGGTKNINFTYRNDNDTENAEQKSINTSELYRQIVRGYSNDPFLKSVYSTLSGKNPADINAHLSAFNNITPLELALDRAIDQAKKYRWALSPKVTLWPGVMGVFAGAAGLLIGLIGSETADCVYTKAGYFERIPYMKDYQSLLHYSSSVALASGILTVGTIVYWDRLDDRLCILRQLLTNVNLDLSKTKLDLTNPSAQKLLTKLRNYDRSHAFMYEFVTDVLNGDYHQFEIAE
jgi:hypothetical protein